MTEYCRLCAELKDPDEIVASISDIEQSMEQKLHACCCWTTENTAEHRLPHSVCVICLDRLDKCWLFAQSVQLAQQRLFEIFQVLGNEMERKPLISELQQPDNLPPAIAFEIQNNTTASLLREHKCEICLHEFRTVDEFNAHRQHGCEGLIEVAADSNFVDCKPSIAMDWNCEYQSNNDNAIADDSGVNEQSDNIKKPSSSRRNDSKRTKTRKNAKASSKSSQQTQCAECGKCFKWQYKLKRHLVVHTERPFECCLCHKRLRFKYQLSEHIKTHPTPKIGLDDKSFQCKECDRSFKKSSDLKRHYWAHSSDCPFECDECGQRFRVNSNLKQHHLKHTNERPYECWLCHKIYKQTMALKLHMKTHVHPRTKTGPCICEQCGKSFGHMVFLIEHQSTHSAQRPHKCDVCGLGYKTKRLLSKHQITHTEFEHKCSECDRAFRKKASLRVHMETHTGVINKPHICDVCGKGFRKNYELTEHRRIHTGEKPYTCEHCNINFRSMSNFYGHLRKKHGISVSARNREEQARATAMSENVTASDEVKLSN